MFWAAHYDSNWIEVVWINFDYTKVELMKYYVQNYVISVTAECNFWTKAPTEKYHISICLFWAAHYDSNWIEVVWINFDYTKVELMKYYVQNYVISATAECKWIKLFSIKV